MPTTLTVNGVGYSYPLTGDQQWGTGASNWAIAVTSGMLQKAGGTFTLTADVNFGATFGLLAVYYKSQNMNPASSGIFRLGNTETVAWRNAANSGNNVLTTDGSDNLTYNGVAITNASGIVQPANGGTGISSYTTGDMLYASGTTTLSKLGIGTTGYLLTSSGSAPQWIQTLGVTHGGTGLIIGTSGGIPYFSSTTAMASSGLLAQYGLMVGGGAGAAPVTITPDASTAKALISGGASANPGWGVLSVPGGGTGATTFTANGLLIGNGTSALSVAPGVSVPTTANLQLQGAGLTGGYVIFKLQASSGLYNFLIGNDYNTANIFEITPSTATDGSTFSTPALRISAPSGAVAITGTATNDSAATGFVGEYLKSFVGTTSIGTTTSVWGDMTSLSLTAGDWNVDLIAEIRATGGATISEVDIGVGTASGTGTTGLIFGDTQINWAPNTALSSSAYATLTLPGVRISIASTTTIYAKLQLTYTGAGPAQYLCRMSARRVR